MSADSKPSLADFSFQELHRELRSRASARVMQKAGLRPKLFRNPALKEFRDEELAFEIKTIYLPDGRLPPSAPLVADVASFAMAAIALIADERLQRMPSGNFALTAPTLRENLMVCRGVLYENEPTAAFGTGFLVASDVLLTATHNLPYRNSLSETSFVVGYDRQTGSGPHQIASTDLYKGDLITHGSTSAGGWTLVRLHRPVGGVAVPQRRRSGRVTDNAPLFVAGYPQGLPLKIAKGGTISDNSGEDTFRTTLDTFKGNSGSPVFNGETNEIEGMLMSGDADLDYNPDAQCFRLHVCELSGCEGELVMRITEVPLA